MSHSTVNHLRWDLKQIFDVAMAEGFAVKNPAAMLFVPRTCSKPKRHVMTLTDVRAAINTLPFVNGSFSNSQRLPVYVLAKFSDYAALVFFIRSSMFNSGSIGERSTRRRRLGLFAKLLASIVREDIETWLASSPGGSEAWLFPSERLTTPISKDNLMDRYMKPTLKRAGLGWVNFQVMRRTFSSLMHNEVGADPKIVADLMGHDVDVNQNIYTQSTRARQLAAVESLGLRWSNNHPVERGRVRWISKG